MSDKASLIHEGGSEPIPSALSEKVRDFLHKGGGVIPKIPIPKWLFFFFFGVSNDYWSLTETFDCTPGSCDGYRLVFSDTL